MEKLNLEELRTQRKQLADKLSSDRMLLAILDTMHIDPKYIQSDVYVINDFYESCKRCNRCPGLKACVQDMTGYCSYLSVINGGLVEQRIACKYQKSYDKQYAHLDKYLINDLSDELSTVKFENIDYKAENESYIRLYAKLSEYLDEACDKGVYIYGDFGVGKSYISAALLNSMSETYDSLSFVKVPEFVSNIKFLIGVDDEQRVKMIDYAKKSKVLVLDDIGAETITAYSRDDIIFPILDYRMENHLLTFFTSNLSIDELQDKYAEPGSDEIRAKRLIERIRKLCLVYNLIGNNKRLEK
ncbi:MAG: ATP-binding protein [Erysipelotrichaceae bacterium]|nr:ATP-binding protein [Erysipelotrichaceae bacterium]